MSVFLAAKHAPAIHCPDRHIYPNGGSTYVDWESLIFIHGDDRGLFKNFDCLLDCDLIASCCKFFHLLFAKLSDMAIARSMII